MLGKQAGWRTSLRKWLSEHKTLQSLYMMLKSGRFWRECWQIRKLAFIVRVLPYTLVPYPGLSTVYDLASKAEAEKLAGAFVECGIWRGGCGAILAHIAAPSGRPTHLFDSFEGLPEPRAIDGARALKYATEGANGALKPIHHIAASLEDVQHTLFQRFGFQPTQVLLHKGWFQDTLPVVHDQIGSIAVLRLDGDWYDSTKVCFEYLYDQVVAGGYIIVDDYTYFEGCKKATDEFLAARGIQPEMHFLEWEGGVYFQKNG